MARGTLITESLRSGATLEVPLRVRRVERVEPTNISPEQTAAGIPATWTLLHFEIDDAEAPRLAAELERALGDVGW
jgi:hypothetical protein